MARAWVSAVTPQRAVKVQIRMAVLAEAG